MTTLVYLLAGVAAWCLLIILCATFIGAAKLGDFQLEQAIDGLLAGKPDDEDLVA